MPDTTNATAMNCTVVNLNPDPGNTYLSGSDTL